MRSILRINLYLDRLLLARIQACDSIAEQRFYDEHVTMVYQMARRMTRDIEEAQDLTQQTFIRAFKKADQYRGEAPAREWLRRIAQSVILSGLAQRRRYRCETALDEANIPEEMLIARSIDPMIFDLRDRLSRAIAQLSSGYRAVVTLYHVDGLTHQQIAVHLGITVSLSKVWLHRARIQLQTLLAADAEDWLVQIPHSIATDCYKV